MSRLVWAIRFRRGVSPTIMIRVGGAMAWSGHGARKGRRAMRLWRVLGTGCARMKWSLVIVMCHMRVRMRIRMVRRMRATGTAESSGTGRKLLDLGAGDNA